MWIIDNLDVLVLGVVGGYVALRLEFMDRRLLRVELRFARKFPDEKETDK